MHLVDGHRRCAADQGFRVALGQVRYVQIVQGQEAALPGEKLLGQRALAGLSRPGHDHGGHESKMLGERWLDVAGKGGSIHAVNDNHSWPE